MVSAMAQENALSREDIREIRKVLEELRPEGDAEES